MTGSNRIREDRESFVQVYGSLPLVITEGEGVFLRDSQGREYLDFSAQYSACSLGHRHQEMTACLKEQLQKLVSVSPLFVTEERLELTRLLAGLAPGDLNRVFLGCTGSDANEFALKIVRCYAGRGKIISLQRSYHGSSAGSAALTGKQETIQTDPDISSLLPGGFIHLPPPYCYRCDFSRQYPACHLFCLDFLERQLFYLGKDNIAAVFMEPILAAGGVIVPPEGYLPELRKICSRDNILLVFDEVVTGIGRTGEMFACSHWGVAPDILVCGKALTGGYIPGSAVLVSERIKGVMDRYQLHGNTHSAYPLMCRAASKNLEIIVRDQLCENARIVGNYLHQQLEGLKQQFPEIIGDVRGKGLLQGIEIIQDTPAREPGYERGRVLFAELLARRLIVELESAENLNNCVIVLHPPLITGKDHVDRGSGILGDALEKLI